MRVQPLALWSGAATMAALSLIYLRVIAIAADEFEKHLIGHPDRVR